LYNRVIEGLAHLPGVVAVSASATLFSGRNRGAFSIEGYTLTRDEQMTTLKEWVTSDYFPTVGLTITQGRGFGPEHSGAAVDAQQQGTNCWPCCCAPLSYCTEYVATTGR
jgi:hypothetical protein